MKSKRNDQTRKMSPQILVIERAEPHRLEDSCAMLVTHTDIRASGPRSDLALRKHTHGYPQQRDRGAPRKRRSDLGLERSLPKLTEFLTGGRVHADRESYP